MDVLPGTLDLRRGDIAERFRPVFGFMVATDLIAAAVASPEGQ